MQLDAICPCFISLQLYKWQTSKHLLSADMKKQGRESEQRKGVKWLQELQFLILLCIEKG